MKVYKTLAILTVYAVMLTSFTHCKCSEKAMNTEETNEKKETEQIEKLNPTEELIISQGRGKSMPLFIKDTYFQRWVAGQQAGGSGINIYFPTLINKDNYKLEKVYFRGMIGDMQSGKASYFANLKSFKDGLVMSNGDNAEYGNTTPTKPEPFPFELKSNECMISYVDKGETKYFQVYNIIEKTGINYPSAPLRQNKD